MINALDFKADTKGMSDLETLTFVEKVKTEIEMYIRSELLSGVSNGTLDLKIEKDGTNITFTVVNMDDNKQIRGSKTSDEYFNTVDEDQFMNRVSTSASNVTRNLFNIYLDSKDKLSK